MTQCPGGGDAARASFFFAVNNAQFALLLVTACLIFGVALVLVGLCDFKEPRWLAFFGGGLVLILIGMGIAFICNDMLINLLTKH